MSIERKITWKESSKSPRLPGGGRQKSMLLPSSYMAEGEGEQFPKKECKCLGIRKDMA